jgi:hypothetical protein
MRAATSMKVAAVVGVEGAVPTAAAEPELWRERRRRPDWDLWAEPCLELPLATTEPDSRPELWADLQPVCEAERKVMGESKEELCGKEVPVKTCPL